MKKLGLEKSKQGFTIVELLVVVAIVALLAALGMVALGGIRAKARDAKRFSNMNTLRTAMERINSENGSYADSDCEVGYVHACAGISTLTNVLPSLSSLKDPGYHNDIERCTPATCAVDQACDYSFESIDDEDYEVYFRLEKGIEGYEAGCHKLSKKGIEPID